MEEFKCAFSATLIANDFGCRHAQAVTRRGGPDIACQNDAAHRRCSRCHERLKQTALPALGFEDDLLSTPHSVLVKIQFGGLLGIQRLVGGAAEAPADIDELLGQAEQKFGGIDAVPYDAVSDDVAAYKLKRRR